MVKMAKYIYGSHCKITNVVHLLYNSVGKLGTHGTQKVDIHRLLDANNIDSDISKMKLWYGISFPYSERLIK